MEPSDHTPRNSRKLLHERSKSKTSDLVGEITPDDQSVANLPAHETSNSNSGNADTS